MKREHCIGFRGTCEDKDLILYLHRQTKNVTIRRQSDDGREIQARISIGEPMNELFTFMDHAEFFVAPQTETPEQP
jgi:hypothetical protein